MSEIKNAVSLFICGLTLITSSSCGNSKNVDYYTEKPPYLQTCKLSEPDLNKCTTRSVQKLIDQLIIGIPEVTQSFGTFDPMHMKDIIFQQGNNAVANVNARMTNVVVKGWSKAHVKQSRVNKKNFTWETKMFLPKMRMDAKYHMEGRILLIPMQGAGDMNVEIENLDVKLVIRTRLYEKGGFTFANVTNVRAELNMTRIHSHFGNLFNGASKEIERSTNEFFNENWRDLYEAIKPVIIEAVESSMHDIMYKLYDLIPANFFIEDIPTSEQLYGKKTLENEQSS